VLLVQKAPRVLAVHLVYLVLLEHQVQAVLLVLLVQKVLAVHQVYLVIQA
jgi:hypothetical protein